MASALLSTGDKNSLRSKTGRLLLFLSGGVLVMGAGYRLFLEDMQQCT